MPEGTAKLSATILAALRARINRELTPAEERQAEAWALPHTGAHPMKPIIAAALREGKG